MRPGAREPGRGEHPGHRATRGIRHQPGHQRGKGGEARRRETPRRFPNTAKKHGGSVESANMEEPSHKDESDTAEARLRPPHQRRDR